jgi:PTH2 family peptidyl-tRNA hydrolase
MYFYPNKDMLAWLDGSFRKIVVGCESLDELNFLAAQARFKRLPFALIEDNGATEFHGQPTLTALAIGPAEDEVIDEITRDLRLL